MKRVLCFGLTLAMMMTLLMTSALAVDSEYHGENYNSG